ncbi:helix-turn-helix transcriptional regulator [Bacillus andreraoultii]|uniref:helix-turn-helix transcriptional regulator n=1 Tax=Bacillus andreraoultii TaxID=1499685 RepID=UPI00053978B3|nr:helix-turn-helix domain-containing protein [Bacillus andreraoultii]
MQQTLKITNVLSDPTRYSIYEYITKNHKNVTVQEIADEFNIHPNVARLHLSKLEDVNMLKSENKKTGKGGRPSRIYRLSNDVIELNFPFRDYHLLAKIAIESMVELGDIAENALYQTGKRYGYDLMENQLTKYGLTSDQLSFEQKLDILKSTCTMLGFYPDVYVQEEQHRLHLQVFNCPFREIAKEHKSETCNMHIAFIKGLLESLYTDFELITTQNMFEGCDSCAYRINIVN